MACSLYYPLGCKVRRGGLKSTTGGPALIARGAGKALSQNIILLACGEPSGPSAAGGPASRPASALTAFAQRPRVHRATWLIGKRARNAWLFLFLAMAPATNFGRDNPQWVTCIQLISIYLLSLLEPSCWISVPSASPSCLSRERSLP